MTTIAWDGYDLAADTQMSSGDRKLYGACKIFSIKGCEQFPENSHAAFAGDVNKIKKIVSWLKGETEKPEGNLNDDVEGLLIYDSGRVMMLGGDDNGILWYDWPAMVGIGSGGDIALGAMLHGATAKEAVMHAMKVDVATGGKVEVVKIKERKGK